ncbi:MAG: UDP-N-acetylmuramoyl-tripeptide--D-alanyl-D-alanine ligase [Actinomycetia bacterium]|nr:UDP-N-acetylmuramoyl-tripeptide--D-alanyl-D-alanine ligase [Actinomycetes bacterium]
MIPTPLSTIARAVGGELAGPPGDLATGVVADSRAVTPGDMFVAIPGERVDGHNYVDAAMAAGAVAVLAQRPLPAPHILVADPVHALGQLAADYVTRIPQAEVVAITGSSGKTSTKDLLAEVFALRGGVVAPVGSFNTEVGLPLTILTADEQTRTLVLEMGARGQGHISYLCGIAPPNIAIALNVGSAHVGEFGSKAAIAQAKSEIYADLQLGGCAVVNADDPLVRAMPIPAGVRTITFGESSESDVRICDLILDDAARPRFTLSVRDWQGDSPDSASEPAQTASVSMTVSGAHNASNAAAAAAAGLAAGLELSDIARVLSQAEARSRWRMEVKQTAEGVTVVNDAYNANPESMAAALKALVEMGRQRNVRTWAVLGEMGEQGQEAVTAHDTIGRLVVRLQVPKLIAVGEGAKGIHLAASHEGSWGDESAWVPDSAAALAMLRAELVPGDIVLIKASRSIGLEVIAAGLLDSDGSA